MIRKKRLPMFQNPILKGLKSKVFPAMQAFVFCSLFLVMSAESVAQQQTNSDAEALPASLTLEEAFERALRFNHTIRIERLELERSANTVFRGNAGQLPELSLSGSAEFSSSNVELELNQFNGNGNGDGENGGGPQRISVTGAESTNFMANLNLSYTLFDGFRGRYRYRELQNLDRITQIGARFIIEQTLLEVSAAYFDLLLAEAQLEVVRENLELSERRVQQTEQAREYGLATRLDQLTAEVNLNSDAVRLTEAENARDQARRELLFLLGAGYDSDNITLDDRFTVSENLSAEELLQSALQENPLIQIAREETDLAGLQQRLAAAGFFPTLQANVGYGYMRQNNDAGQLRFLEDTGFRAGVTLSYPIYDGGVRSRNMQNAALARKGREENVRRTAMEIEKDLLNAYSRFVTLGRQTEINRLNTTAAELQFETAEEAILSGQITSVELREAQINVLNTRQQLNETVYAQKQQEMTLLLLSGQLMRGE
ncbi:MAG: TolC family protein [Balneolales bacterium]|nr:TolC family protein [Balneolales bacterium]